jgi:hypothetical protein
MESWGVFIGLTVVLIGACAMASGRAIAESWRPWQQTIAAAFGLTLADRFLVYALFQGPLLSLPGFILDFIVLAALALLAWRLTLVARMVRQYPWLYRRSSTFGYEEIKAGQP